MTSDLINAYGEHHRHYHNLDHIKSCFKEFEEIESKLKYPLLTKFALLYHDYVYIPVYSGNEIASYCKAILDATELGLKESDYNIIKSLIIATAYSDRENVALTCEVDNLIEIRTDTKFLIDIDLSVFGKNREEFLKYEKNIRKEFHLVNDIEFCEERIQILERFVSKHRIYLSDYFYNKYEKKAKENLRYSIGLLETKIRDIADATNP